MRKEKESVIAKAVEDKKIQNWINDKIEELCQRFNLEAPDDSSWEVGLIEKENNTQTNLFVNEFDNRELGLIIDLSAGQIMATTVYLRLPDKFVLVRKRSYRKDYYLEIPLG